MSERNDREREGHLREHMIYGGDYLKSKLFQFLEKKLDFFVIFFHVFGTKSGFLEFFPIKEHVEIVGD